MANDLDFDKFYTIATYQFTTAPFDAIRIDKAYTLAAYQFTTAPFDALVLDKLYTLAAYRKQIDAVNGDPYLIETAALLSTTGADASTVFVDEVSDKPLTTVGNAQIDTAFFKYGTGSAMFDGSGDRVTASDSPDFNLSNRAFTIEAWVRFRNTETATNTLISQWRSTDSQRAFIVQYTANSWQFIYTTSGAIATQVTITNAWTQSGSTWFHFEVTRDSAGDVRMFIDGTQIGTTQAANVTIYNSSEPIWIGANAAATPANDWDGWIDELRFTKGVGRHDTTFTPPGQLPRTFTQLTTQSDQFAITGVSATGQVGQVAVVISTGTNVTADVYGVQATGSVGQVTVNAASFVTATPTGVQATGSVGQVTVSSHVNATAPVTGVQATASVGTVTVRTTWNAYVPVTGVAAIGEVGELTVIAINNEVLQVPSARMVYVDAEDRMVEVDREDRRLELPAASRVFVVAAEKREVQT